MYSLIVMPNTVMHRRCRTQKGSEGVGLRECQKVSDSENVGRCRVSKRHFSREYRRLHGQGNYKAS